MAGAMHRIHVASGEDGLCSERERQARALGQAS